VVNVAASFLRPAAQANRIGPKIDTVLHSSDELGELWQWWQHCKHCFSYYYHS